MLADVGVRQIVKRGCDRGRLGTFLHALADQAGLDLFGAVIVLAAEGHDADSGQRTAAGGGVDGDGFNDLGHQFALWC